MLRICLVEDEAIALRSLRKKIEDLNREGAEPLYAVVGSADNGADGLDVVTRLRPDVVLTDIRMLEMDGLELIERLGAKGSNTIAVVVSAYQDFQYVKQALRLGVEDYLLKPVAVQELANCLEKCAARVAKKRTDKKIDEVLAEAPHIENVYADGLLLYLIFGNCVAGGDGIVHPSGQYIPSREVERIALSGFERAANACRVHESYTAMCFIGSYFNEKVLLLSTRPISDDQLPNILRGLTTELEEAYQSSVTISCLQMTWTDSIERQIIKCRQLAAQNVLLGQGNVLLGSSGGPTGAERALSADKLSANRLNECIDRLSFAIQHKRQDPLKETVRALCARWGEMAYPQRFVLNDLTYIVNALKQSAFAHISAPLAPIDYVENIVSISKSYADLADNLIDLLTELCDTSFARQSAPLSPAGLVEKIEGYFTDNLNSGITLTQLCARFNYSKAYLCRVFKQEKNMTPIDCFIQMKIERAKRVMRENPDALVQDVSELLGFNDTYYFSKVFKRVAGVSPSAFKESRRSVAQ